MEKEYELISTPEHIKNMQEQCDPRLLNAVFDITEIHVTRFSNFWDASSFIINDTLLRRIDKIQVVSIFMMSGAVVEFDGHSFNYVTYPAFWDYLLQHRFITKEDYDILCNMGRDGQITFINPL